MAEANGLASDRDLRVGAPRNESLPLGNLPPKVEPQLGQNVAVNIEARAADVEAPIKLSELRALKEMGLSQSGRRAIVEGYDLGLGLTRTDGRWSLREFAADQNAKIYHSYGGRGSKYV